MRSMCRSTRQTVPSGSVAVRSCTIHLYLFCRNRDNLRVKYSVWYDEKSRSVGNNLLEAKQGRSAVSSICTRCTRKQSVSWRDAHSPPPPISRGDKGQTDGSWTRSITGHTHTRRPAPFVCPELRTSSEHNTSLLNFSNTLIKELLGLLFWGTRWRSWLRHRATSQKVVGSIPDGARGIFH